MAEETGGQAWVVLPGSGLAVPETTVQKAPPERPMPNGWRPAGGGWWEPFDKCTICPGCGGVKGYQATPCPEWHPYGDARTLTYRVRCTACGYEESGDEANPILNPGGQAQAGEQSLMPNETEQRQRVLGFGKMLGVPGAAEALEEMSRVAEANSVPLTDPVPPIPADWDGRGVFAQIDEAAARVDAGGKVCPHCSGQDVRIIGLMADFCPDCHVKILGPVYVRKDDPRWAGICPDGVITVWALRQVADGGAAIYPNVAALLEAMRVDVVTHNECANLGEDYPNERLTLFIDRVMMPANEFANLPDFEGY